MNTLSAREAWGWLFAIVVALAGIVAIGFWGHSLVGPLGSVLFSSMAAGFFVLLAGLWCDWSGRTPNDKARGLLLLLLPVLPVALPQCSMPQYYNPENRECIRRAAAWNLFLHRESRFQNVHVAWKIGWKPTFWNSEDRRAPVRIPPRPQPPEEWLEVTGTVPAQADDADLKKLLASTDLGPVYYKVKVAASERSD